MANIHSTLSSLFTDIADAIRLCTGMSLTIPADRFPDIIRAFWGKSYKSLNDSDWDYIRWASDSGIADLLWSVGDRKAVNLAEWGAKGDHAVAAGTYYCYILGFNHNKDKEGSNRVHFEFGFDSITGGNHIGLCGTDYGLYYKSDTTLPYFLRMNGTQTNVGGWASSLMRTGTLNGDNRSFLTAIPDDLKSVLKTVTKYTDNVGNNTGSVESNVTATTDTIFLLNVNETRGTGNCNTYERNYTEQYQYYKNGNEQIRSKSYNPSELCYIYLRSPGPDTNKSFMGLNPSGSGQYLYANNVYAISPAFCV